MIGDDDKYFGLDFSWIQLSYIMAEPQYIIRNIMVCEDCHKTDSDGEKFLFSIQSNHWLCAACRAKEREATDE